MTTAYIFFLAFVLIIVMGNHWLNTWARVQMARVRGGGEKTEERLQRLEEVVEELRDQVAELLIDSHDQDRLEAEEETRSAARLRSG